MIDKTLNRMETTSETPVIQKTKITIVKTVSACCGPKDNDSFCCTPSETKEGNGLACCAQPADGSACCDK